MTYINPLTSFSKLHLNRPTQSASANIKTFNSSNQTREQVKASLSQTLNQLHRKVEQAERDSNIRLINEVKQETFNIQNDAEREGLGEQLGSLITYFTNVSLGIKGKSS